MQIEIDLNALAKAESTGRPGLVKRKVKVRRGGKVFEQYRWVKSGDEKPAEKKGSKDEPTGKKGAEEKPKPKKEMAIMGLNKPEKEDFAHKTKVGDIVTVGGKILKVKSVNKETETVTAGSPFIPDETYSFEDLNIKGVHETPEGKFKEEEPKPEWRPPPEKKAKSKPETKEKPEKVSAKKLPVSGSTLLKDKVKSVKEATKTIEDAGWVFDHESDIFPNVDDYDSDRTPINVYTNEKGEAYGMSQYYIDDYVIDEPIVGEIEYLEINTPMRGKGYGKRLMANILKDMLDKKTIKVKLMSLDENSNKFYEAIGMEPEKGDSYTGDAKWMKKFVKANT